MQSAFSGRLAPVARRPTGGGNGCPGTAGRLLHPKGMQELVFPSAALVSIDHASLDDNALAGLAVRGDHEAFRHIMQRFGRLLYRIARGVVDDDTEAEDIVQETFVRAYRKLGTFRGDAPLRSWLVSILLNEARSQLRKRHPMVRPDQIDSSAPDPYWASRTRSGSAGGDPMSLAARDEIHRLLADAIERLPDTFRAVYLLRELEECSVEETAVRLAIKPQTVKTRLYRARRLLRESLGETLGAMFGDAFPFLGMRCAAMTAVLMAWLAVEENGGTGD